MATNNSIDNASAPFGCTGDITITTGNLKLPTSSTTVGQIRINNVIFFHNVGTRNLCVGSQAGQVGNLGSVTDCTNIGFDAGYSQNSNAPSNVNVGAYAGYSNTSGGWNTNVGYKANYTNPSQSGNTAIGYQALTAIGGSVYCTALGYNAGSAITTGYTSNIMIGADGAAADNNTLRIGNGLGTGDRSLNKVYIQGIYTTAATPSGTAKLTLTDSNALQYGLTNTASALLCVAAGGTVPTWSTGPTITGTMSAASFATTTAATITTLSDKTITMSGSDTDVGLVVTPKGAGGLSLTTGTMTAASFATTTAATTMTLNAKTITMGGSDTDVSLIVVPKGAGTITCAAIYSNVVTGSAVLVDSSGNLGVATSSRRFKDNIKDMDEDSSPIMKLRPVSFTYKSDPDGHIKQGLIAEEVEKVMPSLVGYDQHHHPHAVNYHELPVMLLNEIQKLERRIAFLETMLDAKDLR